MSTDKGFIKVYRDIRDHWIWSEKPFDRAHAWIDLLMLANHEKKVIMFDGFPITVKRGQHMTSLSILAERWGWSRFKTKRFLDALKSQQMIDKERNSRGTLLTIVNYGDYQGSRNSKRNTEKTETDIRKNADQHKQYIIEEAKKKEEEELAIFLSDEEKDRLYPASEGWE